MPGETRTRGGGLFFIADTLAAGADNPHAWSGFPMFMNGLEPVYTEHDIGHYSRRAGPLRSASRWTATGSPSSSRKGC